MYSFEADPVTTTFCRLETEIYVSSSSIDSGVLYEVISAGRQVLNSDDFPIKSKVVIHPTEQ